MRKMPTEVTANRWPVAGRPMSSPSWVPRTVTRAAGRRDPAELLVVDEAVGEQVVKPVEAPGVESSS
jgi:hypothetical protein